MMRAVQRLLGLVLCAGLAGCLATAPGPVPTRLELTGSPDADVFRIIAGAANLIEQEHVDPVDSKALTSAAASGMGGIQPGRSREMIVQGAIEAMLATLQGDNYLSDPLPRGEPVAEPAVTGSTGVLVQRFGDGFIAIGTDNGTAAERAGIGTDWVLRWVDGQPVADLTRNALYRRLNGVPGSIVRLEWDAPGQGRVTTELARAVQLPTPVAPDHCVDRPVFRLRTITARALDAILSYDRTCPLTGREAIVLDLRNSSGGGLDPTVRLTSLFVGSGRLFSVVGREEVYPFSAVAGQVRVRNQVPLIVLTNRATASGAELMARALQFLKGALVAGTLTAGLEDIHTVIPLPGTRNALHLLSGRALLADGQPVSNGVTPNLVISDDPATPEDEVLARLPRLVTEWHRLQPSRN